MTITAHEVEVALGKLGPDADAIAATLENKGVRGVRHEAIVCPLANYLVGQFPEATSVVVDYEEVRVTSCRENVSYRENVSAEVGLDDAAATFVRRFDAGAYPALDAGGESDV